MSTKVLLDASILISQHFLKGHLGIALIRAVRRTQSKLVLPEATLQEAKERALDEIKEHLDRIRSSSNQLHVLLGEQPAVPWPGPAAVVSAIDAYLTAIKDVLEHAPLELGDVRGALTRVVRRIVPAHSKEEFRDALLWETALRLSKDDTVYLVVTDNHFRGAGGKLHPLLLKEVQEAGAKLEHFGSLPELLAAMGPEAQTLDNSAIKNALATALQQPVAQAIADRGVTIEGVQATEFKAWATQDPNELALSFEIQFNGFATRADKDSPVTATITAVGSASLDPRSNAVSQVDLDKISVQDEAGGQGSLVFLGSVGISPPPLYRPYKFREPLT